MDNLEHLAKSEKQNSNPPKILDLTYLENLRITSSSTHVYFSISDSALKRVWVKTVVEARQFVDVTPIEYGMITFITAVAEQCTDNLTGGVVILHKQNLKCSDGKKPLPADDWPQRLLLLLLGITTLLWRLCDIRYVVIVQISDHDIDLGLIFFRESLTFPSRGIPDFPVPVLILMVTGRLPLGSNPIVASTMGTCHQPDSRSRIALGWTSGIPSIVQQWNVHICKLS